MTIFLFFSKLTVAAKSIKKENEDLSNSHMQLKQQCGQHLIEISYFIGKVTKLENVSSFFFIKELCDIHIMYILLTN